MTAPRAIHLTRMAPPDAALREALASCGFLAHHLPLREVEDVTPTPQAPARGFDAVLVSSKYAARRLAETGLATDVPFAAVGEGTARAARKSGYRSLFPRAAANAAELLTLLLERDAPTEFLFACGADALPTLPDGLRRAGRSVTELTLYRTRDNPNVLAEPGPEDLVYFQSPSAVAAYLRRFGRPPACAGAIGPTTAAAMRDAGIPVLFQPPRPEASFLAEALAAAEIS